MKNRYSIQTHDRNAAEALSKAFAQCGLHVPSPQGGGDVSFNGKFGFLGFYWDGDIDIDKLIEFLEKTPSALAQGAVDGVFTVIKRFCENVSVMKNGQPSDADALRREIDALRRDLIFSKFIK